MISTYSVEKEKFSVEIFLSGETPGTAVNKTQPSVEMFRRMPQGIAASFHIIFLYGFYFFLN